MTGSELGISRCGSVNTPACVTLQIALCNLCFQPALTRLVLCAEWRSDPQIAVAVVLMIASRDSGLPSS